MKKLLDELQSLKNEYNPQKYTTDADIVFGIEKAIIAVRAHNPWHEVGELPPADESEPDFSIDVLLTDGERCRVGYYAFRTASWIMHRYFKNPVTGWTYLPEGKP